MNDSCKRRAHAAVCSLLLSALLASSSAAADTVLEMARYREYAREVCLDLAADTAVSYELRTPYPLDFDFHYHTDEGTSYLIEHRVEATAAGTLEIDEAGHYCFKVRNTLEPPADFIAHLAYRLY